MKKIIAISCLILIGSLIFTSSLSAQGADVVWSHTYGAPAVNTLKNSQFLANTHFIFVSNKGGDSWLVEINSQGTIEWDQSFAGGKPFCIDATTTGGFFIGEDDDNDFAVRKTNNLGSQLWRKKYSYDIGISSYFNCLSTCPDGGFYGCGLDLEGLGHDPSWVLKCDINGTKLFLRSAGIVDLMCIRPTADNCYVTVGQKGQPIAVNALYNTDASSIMTLKPQATIMGEHLRRHTWAGYIAKVDDDCNTLWSLLLEPDIPFGWEETFLNHVIQAQNGDYLACGRIQKYTGVDYLYDGFLIRVDDDGNILWYAKYGDNVHKAILESVIENSDGSLVLCGSNADKAWVVKTTSGGTLLWEERFAALPAKNARSIHRLSNSEFVFFGNTADPYACGVKIQERPLQLSVPILLYPYQTPRFAWHNFWLHWLPSANAAYYSVSVDDNTDFIKPVIKQNNIQTTSYFVHDLKFDQSYYWKVCAYGTGGNPSKCSAVQKCLIMSQPQADILAPDTYELAYIQSMDFYYIDRDYVISTIPNELSNCLWIKTANDDKNDNSINYIRFKLDAKAVVYIAYDHRASSLPKWLSSQFTATGLSLTTSDKTILDLYSKNCYPGSYSLGGNMAVGAAGSKSNYVVLIKFEPSLVEDNSVKNAESFILLQNYPNPFNSSTTCSINIPANLSRTRVEMVIYNIQGKRVRTLINDFMDAGMHQVKWDGTSDDGSQVTSGIYYCQFKCDGFTNIRKMILLR